MTWVDALVVLIMACSALIAFLRGFVREALGVLAWVGAIYVALTMFSAAQPEVRRYVANPEIADPVALGLVFLVALIGFSLIATIFARVVRLSSLGPLDRTLGVVFGVVRGALLVSGAYIGAGLITSIGQWPEAVLAARSLPYAYQGAEMIAAEMPNGYVPRVDPPPPVAAGPLMQTPPHGFALDGRQAPHTVDSPDANGHVSSGDSGGGGN